ncbi:MAG: anthranilate phosphoribosyltransferase [Thermodesulfobacteriota bacterium]|nr:anthranilate phosphoribosyltransferase [Thermodesulfobacteriota bacterium]
MKQLIEKLIRKQDLEAPEMEQAFDDIMSGRLDSCVVAAFLVALRAKGESPVEIASAARIMRKKAVKVDAGFDVMDTCGTGGDMASTFNISTAVAFVLSGAGIKVAKHGNRSVSSMSGSADCLEALGVPIDMDAQKASDALRDNGFAFLFAPLYHPSMKHAMPVRQALGIRTIFNLLGPLSNPANAAYQVMGVYSDDLIRPMIEVLQIMGLKGAMVVHSDLDEVSARMPTHYARLVCDEIHFGVIQPQDAGISPAASSNGLNASSPKESAAMIEAIFKGDLKGAPLDVVLINSGAAFMALDKTLDIKDGVNMASDIIQKGLAKDALDRARA